MHGLNIYIFKNKKAVIGMVPSNISIPFQEQSVLLLQGTYPSVLYVKKCWFVKIPALDIC